MHVHLSGLDAFVPEPERDDGDVDARVQEPHGCRVPEDVGRHRL